MTDDEIAAALQEEMDAIENYLKAAQDVLQSGYMPDISGFEKRIGTFCHAAQKAPEKVHDTFIPKLKKLQEHLNRFEKNMREFHEAQMKAHNHGNA